MCVCKIPICYVNQSLWQLSAQVEHLEGQSRRTCLRHQTHNEQRTPVEIDPDPSWWNCSGTKTERRCWSTNSLRGTKHKRGGKGRMREGGITVHTLTSTPQQPLTGMKTWSLLTHTHPAAIRCYKPPLKHQLHDREMNTDLENKSFRLATFPTIGDKHSFSRPISLLPQLLKNLKNYPTTDRRIS